MPFVSSWDVVLKMLEVLFWGAELEVFDVLVRFDFLADVGIDLCSTVSDTCTLGWYSTRNPE